MDSQYNANANANAKNEAQAPVMRVKDWVITLIVLAIPIAGFIMAIIWAIDGKNPSKTNFFRAYWILTAILLLVVIVFMLIMMATVGVSGGFSGGGYQ